MSHRLTPAQRKRFWKQIILSFGGFALGLASMVILGGVFPGLRVFFLALTFGVLVVAAIGMS